MFSIHTVPEEFKNTTITSYFSLRAGSHLGAHTQAPKANSKVKRSFREESRDEAHTLKDHFAFEFALCRLRVFPNVSLLAGYSYFGFVFEENMVKEIT